jgi:hypothetical protein
MIEIITGDLLEAKEKYLIHQTNCISTKSAVGIAKSIFDKYPYGDCYADRTQTSKPGTIDIRGDGDGKENRLIINLHGQYYPGRPKYPLSDLDGLAARRKYFYHGLLRVAKLENLESVALNWRISCGIAGGDWSWYLGQINFFAAFVKEKQNTRVVIYKRENDE